MSSDNREVREDLEERTEAQAAASQQDYDALLYAITHDLKSPLRSVLGFSKILSEKEPGDAWDDEDVFLIQRIGANAQRLNDMMDGLTHLSRVRRAPLRLETVCLSTLAQEILSELQLAEPQRECRLHIAPGLEVTADRKLLRVALENLLDNAWKFSRPNQSSEIVLGYNECNSHSEYFVQDDGVGFDDRRVESLGQPFQRLHGEEFEGLGLGLAITHSILLKHNGSFRIHNRTGSGVVATFTLPAAQTAGENESSPGN